jgi:uncharacterized membrane protein
MVYFEATHLTSNLESNDLTKTILETIKEKKPQSVKQLTTMLVESFNLREKQALEAILKLRAQGIIKLEDQSLESRSLAAHVTDRNLWYWLTIAAGAMTTILVFTIPENLYPWIYVRNFFGITFVLYLPGYTFVKALFPANLHIKTSSVSLERIERIALSVGMSVAIVSIVGFIFYYTPWNQNLLATVICLFIFTSISATIGILRSRIRQGFD